jgi:PAS domain S-box-containing protein
MTREFPTPEDEEKRLETLSDFEILDTPPEEQFDQLTRLAADIFDVPISLVSLVDRDRQWWKSCVGVDQRETDRGLAFCNYPVASGETTVIKDASEDPRTSDNPLVTGEMHLRAYAGAPLETEGGQVLGTFCLVDTEPRQFTEDELERLETLADVTFSLIDMKREQSERQAIEQSLHEFKTILDSLEIGVCVTDPDQPDNPIVRVNEGLVRMTGYDRDELLNRHPRFLYSDRVSDDRARRVESILSEDREGPVLVEIRTAQGDRRVDKISIKPVAMSDEDRYHLWTHEDVTDYVDWETDEKN